MAKAYALDRDAIQTLRRDHERLRSQVHNLKSQLRQARVWAVGAATEQYIGRVTQQFTAATVSTGVLTLGTGKVRLQQRETENNTLEDMSTSSVSVFNYGPDMSITQASSAVFVWIAQSKIDSTLYLVAPVEYQPLIRFTLDSTLTTSDASIDATITDQYGPGMANEDTSITAHNILTHSTGVYIFEGDSGDAGLAIWDSAQNYRIAQMECP